ncbi:serpin family protein [Flavonifractor sp.]|uniref:serpin family protein n=1 Tax=Flavonifractor sp. TaxID=2049025 RepID=UPI0025C00FB2|nr:serpin family protein [Flavonifractor sp.]
MKGKLLSLLLPLALLAGCAAPAGAYRLPAEVTDLSQPVEAGTPAPPEADGAADAAIGNLGAQLLRAVREPGVNTLLSPLSISLALSMTAHGAAGDTLAEFEALLGADADAVNANAASLLADYTHLGGSTVANLANSLWLDDSLKANELFVSRCAAFYGAGLYQADLATEGTRRAVNSWVEENTGGMIPQILDDVPAEDTALLLANALYLKNTWAAEFDPDDTRTDTFTAADGAETATDFLSNGIRTERYFRTADAAGVVLPYDDGRLAFAAVLPDGDLDAWLEDLDGGTFPALIGAAEDTRLLLRMPKFEAEWGGELKDVLSALGLDAAFDPARADLSGLGTTESGGPLFIDSVLHRAKIQVDEEGTEAAASTVVMAPAGAPAPMDYEELILDRPFCYAIVDLERGVPLFLGTFERP